jgi:hypothetical protein
MVETTENTETDEKGSGPDQDPENPFLSGLCVLVSYGGLVRSRSQAPGPPSLRPAKLGYARPNERRSEMKITDTTDRLS